MIVDRIDNGQLNSVTSMNLSTQHLLRLLLAIFVALSPVQSAFAMQQMSMHADSSTIAASDHVHGEGMKVLHEDSKKHDGCGNCQGSAHCSNCSMTLAIFQITPIRYVVGAQHYVAISNASFNSTDLLPDYRPPRFF